MRTSRRGAVPGQGEVHVWHGVLTGPPAAGDPAVLSEGERSRSARLLRRADQARFVAAHAGQRRVLACYLAVEPAAIRFGRVPCCNCGSTEHGRPAIEYPVTALTHNLSRSGQQWLLAVALGKPVGVDIECHRSIDIDQLAQACLTESELAHLNGQPADRREAVFFRCWTRKEAVLKACGVGLAAGLQSVEVRPEQPGPVEVRHTSGSCPGTWLVDDLGPDPDGDAGAGRCGEPAGDAPGPWGEPAGDAPAWPVEDPVSGVRWSAAVAQPARAAGPVRFRRFTWPRRPAATR